MNSNFGQGMSLEEMQRMNMQIKAAMGNQSASNDFTQHNHDLNNKLLQSAEHFPAGLKYGLEDEVTLEMMRRKAARKMQGY